MEFHSNNAADRLMINDSTARIVHIVAIVSVALYLSLGSTTAQLVAIIALALMLILQSIIALSSTSNLQKLCGPWPTISTHLVTFAVVSIWVLQPGSTVEISWLVLVVVASFWRGLLGFVVSAVGVSAVWIANALIGGVADTSYLFGYIVTALICGALLARYSEMQQAEHRVIDQTRKQAVIEGTQLRSLINSMADAVIATDRNGVIQLYNAAALLLLNTNQGLKDATLTELIELKDADSNQVDVLQQAQTEKRIIQRDDLIFTNNRDEDVNLYLDLAPIRTAQNNEVDGFIFLLRDITKQKSIEEQRDDFISIISHELRTPIAIAEGNLSTALMNSVTDESKRAKMVEQAHQNVLFLAQLVNDITTLAHAERGDLDEEKSELDPTQFVTDIGENYRPNIEDAGLELAFDVDDDLPPINVHSQRLEEIMQDFLTNAIRYTEDGTITLIAHELSPNLLRIGVKDTGIGLSKSDQAKVFEKFYRSEDYRTRQHNGTGLGLYIARKLSELIGVTVGVESKLNEGSLFYIDISHD